MITNLISINKRVQTVVVEVPIGMHMIYTSGTTRNKIEGQESLTNEEIERFRNKHNFHPSLSREDLCYKMIEHFNSTLKEYEYPRKIVGLFDIYEAKYYTKIPKRVENVRNNK